MVKIYLLLSLCGAASASMKGILVASYDPTYGVAAFFSNDGGPSASSICGLATGSDQTCKAFQPAVGVAIGMALQDLASSQNSSSIALGDPDSPGTLLPQKRSSQTTKDIEDLLDFMGQSHSGAYVEPLYAPSMARRAASTSIHVGNAGSGELKYNMSLQASGLGDGRVTITPKRPLERRVDQTTSVNPLAQPESSDPSSGPGFKVTFQNYPQNVLKGSLQLPTQLSTINELAVAMAQDWASRATEDTNGSRYFGVYGQGYEMITALEIIPEIRGYGIDQEDPHSFCGRLDSFACLANAQCSGNAAQPNGICRPLQRNSLASTSTSSSPLSRNSSTSTLPAYGLSVLSQALSVSMQPRPQSNLLSDSVQPHSSSEASSTPGESQSFPNSAAPIESCTSSA